MAALRWLRAEWLTFAFLAGCVSVVYGISSIYPPAAWIVSGSALALGSAHLAQKEKKP